jgi:hypothetical protein
VHAPHAQAAGCDLGIVVAAPFLGDTGVQKQDLEQVLVQLALLVQSYHRDAQSLLVDLRHAAGHRARRHAADVGVMGDVADEAEQFALDEHRLGEVDVGQVRPAGHVRIVGDEHVAFANLRRGVLGEERVHQPGHRGKMDGQGHLGLGDQATIAIADGGGMIMALLDVGRVGTLHQRDVGLVDD